MRAKVRILCPYSIFIV